MDRGTSWATVHGNAESDMTERLSTHSSVAWVWSPARICCQEFWDISLYTNACYRISTICFLLSFLSPSLPSTNIWTSYVPSTRDTPVNTQKALRSWNLYSIDIIGDYSMCSLNLGFGFFSLVMDPIDLCWNPHSGHFLYDLNHSTSLSFNLQNSWEDELSFPK